MYPFAYHKPQSVDDAAEILGRNDEAKLLAGGMTLVPTMKQRLAAPSDLIDLGGVAELSGIQRKDATLEVGAMTTHHEVASSGEVRDALPALGHLAGGIGHAQVRHRGTIGGSVANNDPAADYPAALLGLGATVRTDRRSIAADAFFVDMFETALEDGEIIVAVEFPIPDTAGYRKFPNPASKYPMAGVFVAKFGHDVRVAVTGAAPCVYRDAAMEAALKASFSVGALDEVSIDHSEFNEDMHGSAEYRGQLVAVMARRAVAAAGG